MEPIKMTMPNGMPDRELYPDGFDFETIPSMISEQIRKSKEEILIQVCRLISEDPKDLQLMGDHLWKDEEKIGSIIVNLDPDKVKVNIHFEWNKEKKS